MKRNLTKICMAEITVSVEYIDSYLVEGAISLGNDIVEELQSIFGVLSAKVENIHYEDVSQ